MRYYFSTCSRIQLRTVLFGRAVYLSLISWSHCHPFLSLGAPLTLLTNSIAQCPAETREPTYHDSSTTPRHFFHFGLLRFNSGILRNILHTDINNAYPTPHRANLFPLGFKCSPASSLTSSRTDANHYFMAWGLRCVVLQTVQYRMDLPVVRCPNSTVTCPGPIRTAQHSKYNVQCAMCIFPKESGLVCKYIAS